MTPVNSRVRSIVDFPIDSLCSNPVVPERRLISLTHEPSLRGMKTTHGKRLHCLLRSSEGPLTGGPPLGLRPQSLFDAPWSINNCGDLDSSWLLDVSPGAIQPPANASSIPPIGLRPGALLKVIMYENVI